MASKESYELLNTKRSSVGSESIPEMMSLGGQWAARRVFKRLNEEFYESRGIRRTTRLLLSD